MGGDSQRHEKPASPVGSFAKSPGPCWCRGPGVHDTQLTPHRKSSPSALGHHPCGTARLHAASSVRSLCRGAHVRDSVQRPGKPVTVFPSLASPAPTHVSLAEPPRPVHATSAEPCRCASNHRGLSAPRHSSRRFGQYIAPSGSGRRPSRPATWWAGSVVHLAAADASGKTPK